MPILTLNFCCKALLRNATTRFSRGSCCNRWCDQFECCEHAQRVSIHRSLYSIHLILRNVVVSVQFVSVVFGFLNYSRVGVIPFSDSCE